MLMQHGPQRKITGAVVLEMRHVRMNSGRPRRGFILRSTNTKKTARGIYYYVE